MHFCATSFINRYTSQSLISVSIKSKIVIKSYSPWMNLIMHFKMVVHEMKKSVLGSGSRQHSLRENSLKLSHHFTMII